MQAIALACAVLFGTSSGALAQTTLNLSQDLVRLGIAATNMTPNQSALDAGPLLLAGVNYAKANGLNRVIADQGAYYFLGAGITGLNQVNNTTIDFQGSDLYLTHLNAGISVSNSTNLVLQNFTIDYTPPPFTQVRVVSVDPANRRIQFSVEPGWQDPSIFNNYTVAPAYLEVHVFRSGQPAPGLLRLFATLPISGSQFTLPKLTGYETTAVLARIRPGDVAVLALRAGGQPVNIAFCTGCTIRNITTYSSPGTGITVAGCQSTLVERVYAMPRPATDSLVSNFGLLFGPLLGANNTFRLTRAIRTLDDGISVVVWVDGVVQSQPSSRSLVLQAIYSGTNLGYQNIAPDGSNVTFESPSDGTIVGSAVIVSHNSPAPATFPAPFQVTFNFDRDLPNLVGTMMYRTDPNQRGTNTLTERNAVEYQSICCTGISMWGVVNNTLRGNYIHRSALTGFYLYHIMANGNWLVPPLLNLSIDNNIIDGTNGVLNFYSPAAAMGGIDAIAQADQNGSSFQMPTSPHQNITITNNFIADPQRSAVWLGNTNGGSVSGNYFLNPNGNPETVDLFPPYSVDALQPSVLHTSQNVATKNNMVDLTSGRMFPTDTQFRELAAYAPGSTIRLNAFSLGTLSSSTVTLTDADGVNHAVTIEGATTHSLDVQIPAATGLGGAYLTLTSGSTKYFGTVYIDSQDNIPAVNGCTYEISPSATSVPVGVASVPILLVTQAGCAYQIQVFDTFVSAGGASSGAGIVTVILAKNSGGARNTTIEIAGRPITLTQAASLTALAHFAAGDTWTTDFFVLNTGTSTATFSIAFRDDNGNPVALPFTAGPANVLSGTIAAQGSAFYEAANSQLPLAAGWGQITADPSIVVQALFRRNSSGTYYEAAVASTSGSNEFLLPFDATTFAANGQRFYTGFAIANLDQAAANVTCTARDPNGVVIPNAVPVPQLSPLGHWANYLFPALADKRGTIDCASNTNIAATALRVIGTDAFSSLPIVPSPSSFGSPSHTALAHFAAGDTWTTDFFVLNTGTSTATFSIAFRDDNGNPVALPFTAGPANVLSGTIAAQGSAYYEATNSQLPLAAGWGQITADPSIVVQALFRRSANGTYYEAAVPSGAGSKEFLLPFDATTFAANGQPFYTGFAIANLDQAAANVTCTADDANGVVIPNAVSVPQLSPLGHWANYLFPALAGKRGTIDCTSNTDIAATALRVIGTTTFSSLPVVSK